MVYLILLCNDRHLWLKPSRKWRLPRNRPKMVTFRVTSITNSGAGFSALREIGKEAFSWAIWQPYNGVNEGHNWWPRSYRDWRWRWRYSCEHCCVPISLSLYLFRDAMLWCCPGLETPHSCFFNPRCFPRFHPLSKTIDYVRDDLYVLLKTLSCVFGWSCIWFWHLLKHSLKFSFAYAKWYKGLRRQIRRN